MDVESWSRASCQPFLDGSSERRHPGETCGASVREGRLLFSRRGKCTLGTSEEQFRTQAPELAIFGFNPTLTSLETLL